jgi:hypothetical protein
VPCSSSNGSTPTCPQFQEHAGGDPCATSVIRRGYGAQIRLVQRRLLTTGAEDVKDGVGAAAIRHARTTAAKPMGVHRERAQGRFQYGPQVVRDAKARRGSCCLVCAHACAWVLIQYSYHTYAGFSDRLLESTSHNNLTVAGVPVMLSYSQCVKGRRYGSATSDYPGSRGSRRNAGVCWHTGTGADAVRLPSKAVIPSRSSSTTFRPCSVIRQSEFWNNSSRCC